MLIPRDTGPAFGLLVRAKRKELGWSQVKLAEEFGTHRIEVLKLENGQRLNPHDETVEKYCNILGISGDELQNLSVLEANDEIDALLPDQALRKLFDAKASAAGMSPREYATVLLAAAATQGWAPPSA